MERNASRSEQIRVKISGKQLSKLYNHTTNYMRAYCSLQHSPKSGHQPRNHPFVLAAHIIVARRVETLQYWILDDTVHLQYPDTLFAFIMGAKIRLNRCTVASISFPLASTPSSKRSPKEGATVTINLFQNLNLKKMDFKM